MYIDSMLHNVVKYRTDEDSVLYGCRLGNKYISINANIATDHQFESGFINIQSRDATAMADGAKSGV